MYEMGEMPESRPSHDLGEGQPALHRGCHRFELGRAHFMRWPKRFLANPRLALRLYLSSVDYGDVLLRSLLDKNGGRGACDRHRGDTDECRRSGRTDRRPASHSAGHLLFRGAMARWGPVVLLVRLLEQSEP